MKICFWGNIARAISGNTEGGSELQSALMAKALIRCGFEVVVIDCQTDKDYITDEGILIKEVKGWNSGIRYIRMLTHRLPRLYKALINEKADIYYCRMRDFSHILAYWAARKSDAKFILATASDLDVLGFKMRLKHFYLPNFFYGGWWWLFSGIMSEITHPYLLRNADFVFVQHEGQKMILSQKRINSILFPNLFDINRLPKQTKVKNDDFVYVGWLDKRKGFGEFFELIEKSPKSNFKVIGPPRDKTGYTLYEKLKSFHNVSLMGELKHQDTLYHVSNSKALISTSRMEGFPNIFIEAWAFGIPVLTLFFDPGGVIEKNELGIVAKGDLNKMVDAMANLQIPEGFEQKAREYVNKYHSLNEHRLKEIYSLFNTLNT